MKKLKLLLLLAVLALCCGCGKDDGANGGNSNGTSDDTSKEAEAENPDAKYLEHCWLELFDWDSLETFSEPRNIKIAGISYPFTVGNMANQNVCEQTGDTSDAVTIGAYDKLLTFTPLKDQLGTSDQFVNIRYLYSYIPLEGDAKGGEQLGALNDKVVIVDNIGTLTYANSGDGNTALTEASDCCLSLQYPARPYIMQVDNYDYVDVDGNIYYGYYEDYREWMTSLLKYHLGKPTKIYGSYGTNEGSFVAPDGTELFNKSYITFRKGNDVGAFWKSSYKLVFSYDDGGIIINMNEELSWNANKRYMSHGYKIYSIEFYSSKVAFDTMPGYLNDSNFVDVTDDIFSGKNK